MESNSAVAVPEVEQREEVKRKRQPLYNVILHDDNEHTYDYVIRMLESLFCVTQQRAYQFACEVDQSGRVILLTTTREHAELKQEQIHSYGADPLIPKCVGSMTSTIEPVM